jgi:hypothetical protein
MPLYLLRFKIETCLTHDQDLTVDFGGHQPVFLFSEKTPPDGQVIAQVEMDADSSEAAWNEAASGLLPQILDAISFATGTPLLLRDCELVLKDEAGSKKRRALYVGHSHVPSLVPLQQDAFDEAKKILASGEGVRLPLCWHRYALDRELALEQFVFNWLAFEALAGDTDVTTRCPLCHEELAHCGRAVSHRSSSKIVARQIFQAAHPGTTDQYFNNEIWNKARNYVFHGRRYPEPKYLGELSIHTRRLHTAFDRHISEVLGLKHRLRPHRGYETFFRRFIFFEWETKQPAAKFANDWPTTHLAKMTDEEDPNGPDHQAAIADGVTFLDYNREYVGW